ncbi:MAG TPA: hypothetical protein VJ955_00630, partial [Desulfuromonadales bacterium]|nr:hypothetical protein [Desulfuromonadales bacterium]
AEMNGYSAALSTLGATDSTFTQQRSALQGAMTAAQENFFQNAFGGSAVAPVAALNAMETNMQNAFSTFNTQTTASSTQVGSMFTDMTNTMNSMMGSGGMGGSGSMMTGSGLQSSLGSTIQNWSTMMVAATLSHLVSNTANLAYTPYTSELNQQLAQAGGTVPSAPDWTSLPDGSYKSLLELRYDLMLVHLIDVQLVANATQQNGSVALTADQLAAISDTDLANRTAVFNGLQGLTAEQMNALTTALTPPQFLLNATQG